MSKKSPTAATKPAASSLAKNPIAAGAALLSGADAPAADAAPAEPSSELVRVYHLNNHGGSFLHTIPADKSVEGSLPVEYRLDKGGTADVPQFVADLWLTHTGFQGVALCSLAPSSGPVREDPKVVALKNENADLDARLKGLEAMLAAAKAAGFNVTPQE